MLKFKESYKKIIFIFFILIFVHSLHSIDIDKVKTTKRELLQYENYYPQTYEKIQNLFFRAEIALSNNEEQRAQNYYKEALELSEKYLEFSKEKTRIDETGEKVKLLRKYLKEAQNYNMKELYPKYYNRFQSEFKNAEALYENGKKAEKNLNTERAFEQGRFDNILKICDKILKDVRLYVDNAVFWTRTGRMIENVQEKINFLREKYYSAIKPDLFNQINKRFGTLESYYEELTNNLKNDVFFLRKDYYYTHIRNESQHLLGLLDSIVDSPQSERVQNIWELHKIIQDAFENKKLYKMFSNSFIEVEELFEETMSVRPYSWRDLTVMEDDLSSYKQIVESNKAKLLELEELKENIEKKYDELLQMPEKFDTISYELLNDISQYILRGKKGYDENNYDLALHSFERAEEFIQRQTIIVELYRFDLKLEEHVEKYRLDEAYPSKFKKAAEMLENCIFLSQRGRFEEAYEKIKKVKSDISEMLSESQKRVVLLEEYGKHDTEDFIIYTVKEGDSLSSIAHKFYGTQDYVWHIWAWNYSNYPNPNHIYPGNVIKLFKTEDFNNE
ncbi:MAG: LysM peptidoglycan-binding domain-containing protein [Candidatus Muiribacteriota bacterium]